MLGANGMLGHEVVARFAAHHEVHGSVRDPGAAESLGLPAELHRFDALRPGELPDLLGKVVPDVVLNCIGIVKQLDDAKRPLPSIAINSLFPHQLADACAAAGTRLIHISTDCVFSGALPLGQAYTEDDVPDARDLYGLSKLLGEVTVPGTLTIRTSIIGWELGRETGLLEWFAAQRGGTVAGYTNAVFSGLTTRAFADVLADVVRSSPALEGLYHVAAAPITKLDLLRMIDERLALDVTIRPVDEPVLNRALDPSRFREATAIEAPAWSTMLDEYLVEERELDEARA